MIRLKAPGNGRTRNPRLIWERRGTAYAMANEHRIRMARYMRKAGAEHGAPIWRRVSEYALKPSAARRTVNVKSIGSLTKDGDVVVFPGKVLGTGAISHSISLFCFAISESAASKILAAGGRILDHAGIVAERPTGREVVLLG